MHFTLATTVSALALIVGSVNAMPAKQTQTYEPAPNLDKLAKLMPKSALPAPDGLQLKYVVLGVGTQVNKSYNCEAKHFCTDPVQNYTCGSDENAAPGTTGAVGKTF